MRITYVVRSFLDYRVPVFEELDRLLDGNLTVIFSKKSVPERVQKRLHAAIEDRAVGMTGELAFGFQGNITSEFSNTRLRIPWQPGILSEIQKSTPDILIGDGFSQWTLPALLFRISKSIPLVMCYERTVHTERNAQWYRQLFRKTAPPFVSAVCVNGQLSSEYAKSLGFPAERITFGHMVADVNNLYEKYRHTDPNQISGLRQKLDIPGNAFVFLSVSKLIRRKGLAEFLHAWRDFTKVCGADKPCLLIVGNGPERSNLESFCREAGLVNVNFAGEIDYADIHKYYAMSDVFLISTLEDNWSLVVPEAMACGLPILCSRYNGCWPELVMPKNGWVFDPLNAEDTIACLKKCLNGRDRLPEMGKNSLEIVQNHNPAKAARAILEACKIAINNSSFICRKKL